MDNILFREMTSTLSVNAHGGLLPLSASVEPDQPIFVANIATQEVRACRVAYVGKEQDDGKREVGIEFLRTVPNIWEVDFPLANHY